MEITNGSTSCRVSYQITTRVSIEQLVCVLSIADRLLTMVYNRVKIATPARYKVSDSVRVSKFKIVFDKGYTPNWSTEVFKIIKVQQTNPVTYLLEDFCGKFIVGGFYEYELHSVANSDVSR